MEKPRNYLIKDVTFNWAKFDTPAPGFRGGAPTWEVAIILTDAQATELEANHFKVKRKDGVASVQLKRKTLTSSGAPMSPVRVVGADKMPIEGSVGNGSKGNVIVWQAPYDFHGDTGITNSLTAVQVTELVEYTASTDVDFDVISGGAETAGGSDADLF